MATFTAKLPNIVDNDTKPEILLRYIYAALQGYPCLGYQNLNVPDTAGGQALTVPTNAKYAIVVCEAAGSPANSKKVVRFTEDGSTLPTASVGQPIGDCGIYEVQGAANLAAFKAIAVDAGLTPVLKIQYFGIPE